MIWCEVSDGGFIPFLFRSMCPIFFEPGAELNGELRGFVLFHFLTALLFI
jgi:hypothetical protein